MISERHIILLLIRILNISMVLCLLTVEELKFLKELEDITTDKLGTSITFECQLSKDGQKVDWFKDKKKLLPGNGHSTEVDGKTFRLVIKKATANDVGTYKAECMNLSTSGKLNIQGMTHYLQLLGF